MIVVPAVGSVRLLDYLTDSFKYWVHLYRNNVALSLSTVLGDFTEADFPGYSPQKVARWFAATWHGTYAQAFGDTVAWTRTSGFWPHLIYGVYVTDALAGNLLFCEPSPFGPIPVATVGQVLDYTPKLTLAAACDESIASMRGELSVKSHIH